MYPDMHLSNNVLIYKYLLYYTIDWEIYTSDHLAIDKQIAKIKVCQYLSLFMYSHSLQDGNGIV